MQPFIYTALPARVIFGFGTIEQLPAEVRALGAARAFVVFTAQQSATGEELARRLGPLAAGTFAGAAMHTPVEVTGRALQQLRACEADCIVALGGGSSTGLGKALALRTDLPQIVIPTTYAGSEATPILGETQGGLKTTQRSLAVLPEVILYDVDLSLTLPPGISAASGLNAMAHAIEALYARDTNPLISALAVQAVAALGKALPILVDSPRDREARSDALYGAWLGGVCLGSVGMALHHKLCHTLGGSFDLPHAETHAVLLPYTVAYNAGAARHAMQRVAEALGVGDAAQGLYALGRRLGVPASLAALGLPESGLDRAADLAAANPYWNPRPIERDAIRALLSDAFHGRPPTSARSQER